MTEHLDRALAPLLRDLEAAGAPLPRVEPSDWQDWPSAESAYLSAEDGSGTGIWVDTAEPPAEQVAMLADQVQDWAVEELWGQRRSTNWPVCEEHPFTHPLEPAAIGGVALWRCPASKRPICEIGLLRGADAVPMSVVPVDERDSGWEESVPRFRVYLQASAVREGHERTGGSTSTFDVVGADVLQVIDWAQRRATNGATYAIALVVDEAVDHEAVDGRGLVWLVGIDGNDVTDAMSREGAAQERMLTRREHPVGIPDADRSPR